MQKSPTAANHKRRYDILINLWLFFATHKIQYFDIWESLISMTLQEFFALILSSCVRPKIDLNDFQAPLSIWDAH